MQKPLQIISRINFKNYLIFFQYNIHKSCQYNHSRTLHSVFKLSRFFSSIASNDEDHSDQNIPKTVEEAQEIFSSELRSHPDSKLLKVAIIGVPNTGKSTLINQIIGWRVCSVSPKVHTTQSNARAICNLENTQLVFLDTPGVVTPDEIRKYRLSQSLASDAEISLQKADVIAVLHDISNKYTRHLIHPRILRLLALYPKVPSILVLNKVDKLKNKRVLLQITNQLTDSVIGDSKINTKPKKPKTEEVLREEFLSSLESAAPSIPNHNAHSTPSNVKGATHDIVKDPDSATDPHSIWQDSDQSTLTLSDILSGHIRPTERQIQNVIAGMKGWPKFQEVFMVSALDGTGVSDLKNYFLKSAVHSPWIFSGDMVTDQSPQEIAILATRSKCLEHLKHNIPYQLKFKIIYWDLSQADVINIVIEVSCTNKSHMKLLIGPSGQMVKKIAFETEQELRNTFRTEIRLRLSFTLVS